MKNDWNPGTLVLIWECSVRAIRWIWKWLGLGGFQKSLWFLVLWTKVASALEGLKSFFLPEWVKKGWVQCSVMIVDRSPIPWGPWGHEAILEWVSEENAVMHSRCPSLRLTPRSDRSTSHSLKPAGLLQGLSHLFVQRVIWTPRTLFFDSLYT